MLISKKTKDFIKKHIADNVFTLGLQSERFPEIDLPKAIIQIEGRQKTKNKLPTWFTNFELLYPSHLPLEQCSSEMTANYKSSLVKGNSFVDLTGGFGVDCSFLAKKFKDAVYVERQSKLCQVVAHNFQVLGLSNIKIIENDSLKYLRTMQPVDVIFIDPARRNANGTRVYAIDDCEPNLIEINNLLLNKADKVFIKLSPMLDLYAVTQQLKQISEIHVVSVGNECKELLVLLNKHEHIIPLIYCINMLDKNNTQSFVFNREEETSSNCEYTSIIKKYFYEPNTSILKAGAYKSLAVRFGLQKLHPNSHLYTSDEFVRNFPGRIFQTLGQSSFSKKELRSFLLKTKKANISTRNFPLSTAQLYQRLKLSEGGDDYLFATTVGNEQHIIIRGKKR